VRPLSCARLSIVNVLEYLCWKWKPYPRIVFRKSRLVWVFFAFRWQWSLLSYVPTVFQLRKDSWYSFLLGAEPTPDLYCLEGLGKSKKKFQWPHLEWNRDFRTYGIVPQRLESIQNGQLFIDIPRGLSCRKHVVLGIDDVCTWFHTTAYKSPYSNEQYYS
jgi:hypothetical protein